MSVDPRRLLYEPLLHFLVLGAVLFLLYALFGETDVNPPRERIVVDESDLARLSQRFQRTWIRPPTREELLGLAEDHVKEEILYREALALGLDSDDLVIRRRLRQKMEFLNSDLTDQQTPTEAELETYLAANPEKFRRPDRFDLQQICFNSPRDGVDPGERAQSMLARLESGQPLEIDPVELSDPTLLPPVMEDVTAREIANVFGGAFAEVVIEGKQGEWTGPYRSPFGMHVVRLDLVEAGRVATLEEVRDEVEREWTHARRLEANARFYQALRDRYSVEIRLPEVTSRGAPP